MQRQSGRSAAMLLVALSLCSGVRAHHSAAMFDRTRTVELAGVIKQYQFTNPHVWIEMLVPEGAGGHRVQWSIEGEGPAIMARMGLGPSVLKVGDEVTIRAHPLRDGRPGGSFVAITLPDGKVIAPPKRFG
jgi:Family of unknown function (DUF6152)